MANKIKELLKAPSYKYAYLSNFLPVSGRKHVIPYNIVFTMSSLELFMRFIFFVVFFVSCGKPLPADPVVVSPSLSDEIARVEPLLFWCDGLPASNSPNNVDGREHCDTGDGWIEGGFVALLGENRKESIFDALANSFGVDDQPFRSPSYVNKDFQNEFSRDQLLGGILAANAGMPVENGLNRILAYEESAGKLCPNPTDSRCLLTPEMKILAKYALGENVDIAERAALKATLLIEASTAPLNYQAALVAYKIFSLIKVNELSNSYAEAMENLFKRSPNNLLFHTIYHISNKGTQEDFDEIAKRLTSCLQKFQVSGTDWAFNYKEECHENAIGHELVALGKLLTNIKETIHLYERH
jgi:hypothetical protein